MKPIPIPDELGIQGATKTMVRGGDTGAEDVEALVGTTDDGVPFFAMLIEADELDMRSFHLDRRFWLFQLGVPLHPFSLETAFVDAKNVDESGTVGDYLSEMGRLLGAAWHCFAVGDIDGFDDVMTVLSTKATLAGATAIAAPRSGVHAGIATSGLRVVADVDVNGRRTGSIAVPLTQDPSRQLDGHVETPSPTDEDGSDGAPG